jgi:hypothetical protein
MPAVTYRALNTLQLREGPERLKKIDKPRMLEALLQLDMGERKNETIM